MMGGGGGKGVCFYNDEGHSRSNEGKVKVSLSLIMKDGMRPTAMKVLSSEMDPVEIRLISK
jgi:hypothetical protein